jgi:hypothetical protein
MADPLAATLTQLRNIQARTGQSITELHAALSGSGLSKHGEKRSWLMARYALGYGDANTVVSVAAAEHAPLLAALAGQAPAPAAASAGDPLSTLYTGAKAHLRPLHEAVMAAVAGFGDFEQAPKKTYVSLRRKKQFAMLGPATKDLVEVGLNVKGLPPHPRLKVMPPGGMCAYAVRLGSAAEVDADLVGWLRQAYDGA